MAKPDRYKKQEIIAALKKANGLQTVAADILGCEYHTVQKYINKHPSVMKAYRQAKVKVSDKAENNIHEAINNKNIGVSKWYLEHNTKPYKKDSGEIEFSGTIKVKLPSIDE